MGNRNTTNIPPPPPGFTVDLPAEKPINTFPEPPPGYALDPPKPSIVSHADIGRKKQEDLRAGGPIQKGITSALSSIENIPAEVIKAAFPQGPVFEGDLRNVTPVGAFTNLARQYRSGTLGKENPTFSANDVAGLTANAVAPVALSKLVGIGAKSLGSLAKDRPYSQLNEISRQKGGMPVSQLMQEEGLVPENYKQMATDVGQLQSKEYPSAMNQIAERVKASKLQMEPPESVFSELQGKLNEWKKSKTRSSAAEILQKDLDETVSQLQGGDFINYGDAKSGIKTLGESDFGIIKDSPGISSTYGKMKGEALRFARANAAEAAQPGLGQDVFDIGNKQQTLQAVGKKIGQKAVAESQSPTIGGIPRFFEKMVLEKPGPMIRGGRQLESTGRLLESPWNYLTGKTRK